MTFQNIAFIFISVYEIIDSKLTNVYELQQVIGKEEHDESCFLGDALFPGHHHSYRL